MVDNTNIINRAWKVICSSVNQIDGMSLRAAQERLEPVYREFREWQSSTYVSCHFDQDQYPDDKWQSRCLSIFLYLRANELCIFLCRPILLQRNSLPENRGTMEFAATLAKDSISVVIEFYRKYPGIRAFPFVLNQFLSSAMATLFLVIIHEPERYITPSGDVRPPLMAAKHLVEQLEQESFVERRFYRTIREDFEFISRCRILGRDPERQYHDSPEPTTQAEFDNALTHIEPLWGRIGRAR